MSAASALLRVLESRPVSALLVVALVAPAALRLALPVENGDIAWHLALGRWIARNASVPSADPFTYTARGAPMVAHEWLSQWLYWQWTRGFGLDALRWLHVAFAFATAALGFASFRVAGAPPSLALLATAAFTTLCADRFQVRPHMLNPLLAIPLLTAVLYTRASAHPRGIAGLFVAIALWANLHSAAAMLPALVAVWLAGDLLQRRLAGAPPWPDSPAGGSTKRAALLVGVLALPILATPNHVRLLPYLAASRAVNSGRSTEWLSLLRFVDDPRHAALTVTFAAILLATLWATRSALRERRDGGLAAVALACALAPLASVRFVWLSFVPLGVVAGEMARRLARLPRPRHELVCATCAAGAAMIATVGLARAPTGVGAPGAQPFFAANAFPLHSVRLLDEVPLAGRVFTRAEWGGFVTLMLDERVPTFADGRWVTIGESIVRDAHRIATGRPRALELLDQYDVDVVIVERGWLGTDRDRARRGRAWVRAFASYNSAIWVRRGPRGTANRAAFAAYYAARGIPFDAAQGFHPVRAEQAAPDWARAHGIGERSVRHFLPDGRRSERGYETRRDPSAGGR